MQMRDGVAFLHDGNAAKGSRKAAVRYHGNPPNEWMERLLLCQARMRWQQKGAFYFTRESALMQSFRESW
jgi:hypothetical protein